MKEILQRGKEEKEEHERYQLNNKERKELEFEPSQLALKELAKNTTFFNGLFSNMSEKCGEFSHIHHLQAVS